MLSLQSFRMGVERVFEEVARQIDRLSPAGATLLLRIARSDELGDLRYLHGATLRLPRQFFLKSLFLVFLHSLPSG